MSVAARDAWGVPRGMHPTVQVCQELGISYRQAHHWVTRGWIPGLSPRGSGSGNENVWYWTPDQVEAARRVRDHLDLARALRRNPTICRACPCQAPEADGT